MLLLFFFLMISDFSVFHKFRISIRSVPLIKLELMHFMMIVIFPLPRLSTACEVFVIRKLSRASQKSYESKKQRSIKKHQWDSIRGHRELTSAEVTGKV